MSVRLSRGDRTLLAAGGAVLILIVGGALLASAGQGTNSDIPAADATGSGGAKAAFLLLEATGYQVARWERPPSALTDPARTTLVVAGPTDLPTDAEVASLARFLEAGGRVVTTGVEGARLIGAAAQPEALATSVWADATPVAPSSIARAAPIVRLAEAAHWMPGEPGMPLYAVEGRVVAVRVRLGSGDAIWWASATPLTNAGISVPGNLECFLASVGPAAGRRVLWDEYFHGRRDTLAGAVLHSPVKWLFAQIALVSIALVWTFSRRSGPIVTPVGRSRLSPLEFVRTLGSLYGQAGATAVALDAADQRARDRLSRRFGLPSRASAEDIGMAVAKQTADGSSVGPALRAVEAARGDGPLGPARVLALVQSLAAAVGALDQPRASRPRASKESP